MASDATDEWAQARLPKRIAGQFQQAFLGFIRGEQAAADAQRLVDVCPLDPKTQRWLLAYMSVFALEFTLWQTPMNPFVRDRTLEQLWKRLVDAGLDVHGYGACRRACASACEEDWPAIASKRSRAGRSVGRAFVGLLGQNDEGLVDVVDGLFEEHVTSLRARIGALVKDDATCWSTGCPPTE